VKATLYLATLFTIVGLSFIGCGGDGNANDGSNETIDDPIVGTWKSNCQKSYFDEENYAKDFRTFISDGTGKTKTLLYADRNCSQFVDDYTTTFRYKLGKVVNADDGKPAKEIDLYFSDGNDITMYRIKENGHLIFAGYGIDGNDTEKEDPNYRSKHFDPIYGEWVRVQQ